MLGPNPAAYAFPMQEIHNIDFYTIQNSCAYLCMRVKMCEGSRCIDQYIQAKTPLIKNTKNIELIESLLWNMNIA